MIAFTIHSYATDTYCAELTEFTKKLISIFFLDKYTHNDSPSDYDLVIYSRVYSEKYRLLIFLSEKDMYISDAVVITPEMVGGKTMYGKYRTYYVGENNPMFGYAQNPFKDKELEYKNGSLRIPRDENGKSLYPIEYDPYTWFLTFDKGTKRFQDIQFELDNSQVSLELVDSIKKLSAQYVR